MWRLDSTKLLDCLIHSKLKTIEKSPYNQLYALMPLKQGDICISLQRIAIVRTGCLKK